MVKIDWNPHAARTVLGLASADQRRVVDAVGEFRWRLEHEVGLLSAGVQHSMMVGGFEIRFRVVDDVVEVRDVKMTGDQR